MENKETETERETERDWDVGAFMPGTEEQKWGVRRGWPGQETDCKTLVGQETIKEVRLVALATEQPAR